MVLAVPIILGAMSGVMSERVGITNIAIEGQLLTGAFMAAVVSSITDNFLFGIIAAMVTSSLVSMILAVFSIRFMAQQIIVGVVLNVLVIGITNFLYQQWLTEDAQNVNFPGTLEIIKIPLLSDIPILGPIVFENRITVYLALLIAPILWFVLFKTRLGLRARAVGEHPLAADTVGINVRRTRFWWVTIGGAIAGLGGAALTIGNAGAFGRDIRRIGLHRSCRGNPRSLAPNLCSAGGIVVWVCYYFANLGGSGQSGCSFRFHCDGSLFGNNHCGGGFCG